MSDRRLVVELDGRRTHDTRRKFESDRRKDAALQGAGHRVVRITPSRLNTEPGAIGRELRRLLGP